MGNESPPRQRLETIDLLRGTVMIIMALDHVRDFFTDRIGVDPVDLKVVSPALFLTRWITHFCARHSSFWREPPRTWPATPHKPQLSWFLFSRGLWLAFFEVSINRAMWMFNFDWHHHGAGVFWAIGWAMVALSLLVWLPTAVIASIGLFLVAYHNRLDGLTADQVHLPGWIWMILHDPQEELPVVANYYFGTGYCLIPWIGVMAAGYGFGSLWLLDRPIRRRRIALIGVAVIVGYFLVRGSNIYGDPNPWTPQSNLLMTGLSCLNCCKYPASLSYCLMTLGPAIIFLAIFDRPLAEWARPVIIFGRVPLFYYVLHILLIHGGAVCSIFCVSGGPRSGSAGRGKYRHSPCRPITASACRGSISSGYSSCWPLYAPCRWYAGVKQRHRTRDSQLLVIGEGGVGQHSEPQLIRGIGVRQATALNVTFIVGAGVFVTIPLMLGALPGPYALLGWLAAGLLIFFDGLIWSELGAALPGSGGSYQFLLECYGRDRWGRLFAFLFIWQFLVSGPLELGSGLVAIAQFSTALSPAFQEFNAAWSWKWVIWSGADPDNTLAMSFGPSRLFAFLIGVGIVVLLGRDITKLGRITVTFWFGVMAAIVWIIIEGAIRFDPNVAFDFSGPAATRPDLAAKLGPAMILAIYSYLGYYNVCYIGDEVPRSGSHDPTIDHRERCDRRCPFRCTPPRHARHSAVDPGADERRQLQPAGRVHASDSRTVGRHRDHRAPRVVLYRLGVRRLTRLLANSVRGREARALFPTFSLTSTRARRFRTSRSGSSAR